MLSLPVALACAEPAHDHSDDAGGHRRCRGPTEPSQPAAEPARVAKAMNCIFREVYDQAHRDRLWFRTLHRCDRSRALTRQRQRRVGQRRVLIGGWMGDRA
jgi:hypothetical protein